MIRSKILTGYRPLGEVRSETRTPRPHLLKPWPVMPKRGHKVAPTPPAEPRGWTTKIKPSVVHGRRAHAPTPRPPPGTSPAGLSFCTTPSAGRSRMGERRRHRDCCPSLGRRLACLQRGTAPPLAVAHPHIGQRRGGVLFVPVLPRKHIAFWREVVLVDHPLRDTLLPYLEDGVNLRDFLIDSPRGPSPSQPYKPPSFPTGRNPQPHPVQFHRVRRRRGGDSYRVRLRGEMERR